MSVIKRAIKAIKGDFREFRHAIKNPKTYTVPGGSTWKDKTNAERAAVLAKQKEVRGESVMESTDKDDYYHHVGRYTDHMNARNDTGKTEKQKRNHFLTAQKHAELADHHANVHLKKTGEKIYNLGDFDQWVLPNGKHPIGVLKTPKISESVQVDEGIFGPGSVRHVVMADFPLVHAYATGYNHPHFNGKGDVEPPKRNHVVKVGKQRIPSNGFGRISDFEHALRQNGHDEETAHVHGAIHSYDFHNNPTKHDEVLPNSARNLVKKTRGSGMEAAMRGVATVRALYRKPDKPNM